MGGSPAPLKVPPDQGSCGPIPHARARLAPRRHGGWPLSWRRPVWRPATMASLEVGTLELQSCMELSQGVASQGGATELLPSLTCTLEFWIPGTLRCASTSRAPGGRTSVIFENVGMALQTGRIGWATCYGERRQAMA